MGNRQKHWGGDRDLVPDPVLVPARPSPRALALFVNKLFPHVLRSQIFHVLVLLCRDCKPENILLGDRGHVRVFDVASASSGIGNALLSPKKFENGRL